MFFQIHDGVGGVERADGIIADTACERQQQSGDKAGIFGVFGRKLAAVVGGQSNNKNVRYFFPFQPEGWGRRSEVIKTNCFRGNSQGCHFCLSAVVVVEECTVAVNAGVGPLVHDDVIRKNKEVGVELAAPRSLHAVTRPHLLHDVAQLNFREHLRTGVVALKGAVL